MKALAVPLALMLSAGLAVAHESGKPNYGTKASTSVTTHDKGTLSRLEGEVVSTDLNAHSLVLKTDTGDQTLMVKGKAVSRLKNLNPGERVIVKSRNDEVISIKPLKAKAARHASHAGRTTARASRRY
jgi:hypothetical protein